MSREPPVEDTLSLDELADLLAAAEGTTPEEIDRQAEGFEIAPPGESTVVGYSDGTTSTKLDEG